MTLSWELARGSLLVQQVHDHQDNTGTATLPLLVLDMWEHAYYLQYSNRKQLWFLNFWDMIHWADVGRRFDNAGVRGPRAGPGAGAARPLSRDAVPAGPAVDLRAGAGRAPSPSTGV